MFINDGYTYRLIHNLIQSSQAYDFPHHSNIGFLPMTMQLLLRHEVSLCMRSWGRRFRRAIVIKLSVCRRHRRILIITLRCNVTGHLNNSDNGKEKLDRQTKTLNMQHTFGRFHCRHCTVNVVKRH